MQSHQLHCGVTGMEERQLALGECSQPPPLDELALIAAADNEATEEITAHLAVCPYCADRAHDLADFQLQLRRRLFRMFCPSSERLVGYARGLLSAHQQAEVAEHIATCPHCTYEFGLISAVSDEAFAPPLAARRVVAEPLLPKALAMAAFSRSPQRRPARARQYTYQAGRFHLTINVAHSSDRTAHVAVRGDLLFHGDSSTGFAGATVSLLRGERVIGGTRVDAQGNFVFERVLPGTYDLALRLLDREIVVEALSL